MDLSLNHNDTGTVDENTLAQVLVYLRFVGIDHIFEVVFIDLGFKLLGVFFKQFF